MTTLRHVHAINITDLHPTTPSSGEPIFETIDPTTLLVDPDYQRDIGERGLRQIRKMIEHWDWSKFRAPVCAFEKDDDGSEVLKVIDGQHTCIAAASHPHIHRIPVQIVEAPDRQAQASAFIGQNVDRLGITKLQLHHAALTAGNEHAQDVQNVCDKAGIKILLTTPHRYRPGDTVAINAISSLVKKHSVMKARQILEVLANAELAPVKDAHIKAAELLMTDAEYCEAFAPEDLTSEIVSAGVIAESEAKVFAAAHNVPFWRALAIQWFRKTKKRRVPSEGQRAMVTAKLAKLPKGTNQHAQFAHPTQAGAASMLNVPERPRTIVPHAGQSRGNVTSSICGDPAPGRSALDMRKASA